MGGLVVPPAHREVKQETSSKRQVPGRSKGKELRKEKTLKGNDMKTKAGILCLVLVLCLIGSAVGLALWSDTLTISGTVNTGNIDPVYTAAVSNDDGVADAAFDPDDDGADPEEPQTAGVPCVRYLGDSASTTVGFSDKELSVSLVEAFPSYYPTVWYDITNEGTVPVALQAIWLDINGNDQRDAGEDVVPCTLYYLDLLDYDGTPLANPVMDTTLDVDDDLMVHVTGLVIGDELDAGQTVTGDLHLHVEDGAPPEASMGFTLKLLFVQYNEYQP
jgi:predicted ribosomally synthesized peptide with SipW-like signal peptide